MQGYSVKIRIDPLKGEGFETAGVEVEVPLPPIQMWLTESYWTQVGRAIKTAMESVHQVPSLRPYNIALDSAGPGTDSNVPSTYQLRPQSSED